MQNHIKNYFEYYWIEDQNQIRCEVCWMRWTDIHHIIFRSHFWKNKKKEQDSIENLIALCRLDHDKAHFKTEPYLSKEELQEIHNLNL